MDAPASERPMGARCVVYTLHRVSTPGAPPPPSPHARHVCISLSRARKPFYATFCFVSRCCIGATKLRTLHVYVHVCTCILCIYIYIHPHIHVCMYMYVHAFIMYLCICLHMYTCMYCIRARKSRPASVLLFHSIYNISNSLPVDARCARERERGGG